MFVLITYKNEKGPLKNEGAIVATMISPLISLCEIISSLKGKLLQNEV